MKYFFGEKRSGKVFPSGLTLTLFCYRCVSNTCPGGGRAIWGVAKSFRHILGATKISGTVREVRKISGPVREVMKISRPLMGS